MIPAKLRRMLDPGARRRMAAAACQRAEALDRGDEAAADAVTERYVAAEWARRTPRIVPAGLLMPFAEAPTRPPDSTWRHTMSGEDAAEGDDR